MFMKSLLTLMAVCYTGFSFAQATSGTVRYQRVLSLAQIETGNVPPEIAAMLPKEHVEEKVLYFSAGKSLYENSTQKAKPVEEPMPGGSTMFMSVSGATPDEKVYLDLDTRMSIEQKSLMDRLFLIREEIKPLKWKITGNQKKILGYAAMEAIAARTDDTITAWFTTEIPVATGPDMVCGLPGLVLEAAVGRQMTYKAVNVSTDAPDAGKIKIPVKGKKITSQEYIKLAREKAEEMGGTQGGKGIMIKMIGN